MGIFKGAMKSSERFNNSQAPRSAGRICRVRSHALVQTLGHLSELLLSSPNKTLQLHVVEADAKALYRCYLMVGSRYFQRPPLHPLLQAQNLDCYVQDKPFIAFSPCTSYISSLNFTYLSSLSLLRYIDNSLKK